MFDKKEQSNINETVKGSLPEKNKVQHFDIKINSQKSSSFISFAENFIQYYQLIILVFAILIIVIGLFFSLKLYNSHVKLVKSAMAQNMQLLQEKKEELLKLKSAKVSYEGIESASQKIIDALPTGRALPSLYIQLEELAIKNGLNLETINIADADKLSKTKKQTNKKEPEKLAVSLKVNGGDYFKFKDYLADIEKNLRLMDIQSLSYNPQEASYNLTVNVYYLTD